MSDADVHGPIDFLLLEFPGDRVTGRTAEALGDLVDRGVVRLYDLVVLRKQADGSIAAVALEGASDGQAGGFVAFAGARSGLLSDSDLADAAATMNPDTIAALIVYENAWAIPFVAAALEAGGAPIASARIPATDVAAALDALDASA